MTTVPHVATPPAAPTLTGAGLTALGIAYFLSTFLFGSANVALPDIGSDLHAGAAGQALVIGAYAAVFATLLIQFGRLGDNIGRHRVFVGGLLAVAVASIIAGCAPDSTSLIVLRAVQGAAAAAFTPQILSTIQASTTGAARTRAVAVMAATAGVGFSGGQLIGGGLVSANVGGTGWRPVFWFAAIIAVIAAIVGRSLPATRGTSKVRLDGGGTALLTIALLCLLVALSVGSALSWPLWTWLMILVALAAIVGFWHHQRWLEGRGGAPMVPPTVLAHRPIRIGLVMVFLFFAVYGAFVYEYAVVSERTVGMAPFASGLSLVVFAGGFTVVSLLLPRITAKLGSATMVVGALLQGAGMLVVAATHDFASNSAWPWVIQPGLIMVGCGQALQFGPLVSTIMGAVPDRIAGLTGGLFSTVQQGSLALGVAVFGGVFTGLAPHVGAREAFSWVLALQAVATGIFLLLALYLRRTLATKAT